MRSFKLPVSTGPYQSSFSETAVRAHYVDLTQQHHDLDYMIFALSCSTSCDELLVARLKKRKLHLKDEIARVEGDLHMTGDATAHP
jgi:hypothetical protein